MTPTKLSSYLDELPCWHNTVKNRHILFDTDAIISILSYKAEIIFDQLQELNVTNCYIHPIYTELLMTNSSKERVLRQSMLSKYNFYDLPITNKDLNNASNIQLWLFNKQKYPSPTDLYIGGKLASFRHTDILLLTSNISDFIFPLFIRKGGIVLQNEDHTKILSILSIDHSQIVPF